MALHTLWSTSLLEENRNCCFGQSFFLTKQPWSAMQARCFC